eukprot:6983517-Heterocapsa_arctica.AAC.1
MKEAGLKDFMEIANYLEATLMERLTKDEEEDQEEAEPIATGPQTFNLTEGAVKQMSMMNYLSEGILNKMKEM